MREDKRVQTPGESAAPDRRRAGLRVVSSEPGVHDNLPLPLTSFVGREAEVEEVRGMVHRGRLVTLTGVGGCGKTRLALEAARSLADDLVEGSAGEPGSEFPDGIWLVELGSLTEPSLVAREAASVLGIGERPGRGLDQELPEALREERCLILLDNCEHLVGACAELAEGLLRRCPGLAVLATSREPLGAAGERVWPVPALSVPDSPSLEAASRSESARLFAERAAAASPGFELEETNVAAVAEVCRRLDGAPLAIELAASRVRSMTPAQISARLDDALGLLASGLRTAPPRQSTLRAAIDWSYGLLSPPERALFRNLSVFSGGFTLEAAEEICRPAGGSVLDLLSRLVDKSLVGARRTGEAARYRLQEVIRQYASEKSEEAGEVGEMRRRHAVFFRDFAEEAEPGLDGPDRELWLDLVSEDLDNLRAAMSWAADSGEGELGLRLSGAIAWFWLRRGRLAEGRASLERALEVGAEPALAAAKANHVSGALAWAQGDRAAAGPRLGEAVERFRELDDYEFRDSWLSSALSVYSLDLLALGETGRALAAAAESVAAGRRVGESSELARALGTLGLARMAAGDFDEAAPPLEESAAICRRRGDGWTLSFPLGNLAAMALWAGDYERARSLAKESVRALRGLDEKWLLSVSLAYLAAALAARGRARRAAARVGARAAQGAGGGPVGVYPHYRAVHDRGVESVRDALGAEEFAAAWAAGRAMGAEEAISFALEEDGDASEEPPVPTLRVLALGQTRVEVGGAAVRASDWRYAKVAELFFYLVNHPPRTREKIGLDLWPDASPSQLRNALHSAMYRLRKSLGPPNRIRFTGGRYTLDHTMPLSFDVADFEEKTRRAHQRAEIDPGTAATLLEQAADLYRGDFLEGFSGGEWIFIRQQELREIHVESQLLLGRLLTERDENSRAARAYRRAIAHDPYSAEAHAGLIRAYSRHGERARALRHYQDLEHTLRRDLGATPSPELTALIERLRRGEEI